MLSQFRSVHWDHGRCSLFFPGEVWFDEISWLDLIAVDSFSDLDSCEELLQRRCGHRSAHQISELLG